MCSKLVEFKISVSATSFDVIALTETWRHEDISSSELFGSDYVIHRHDRKRKLNFSRGGGVLLAVKARFRCKFIDVKLPDADFLCPVDLVCVKITSVVLALYILVVYFPPSTPVEQFDFTLNFISNLAFNSF